MRRSTPSWADNGFGLFTAAVNHKSRRVMEKLDLTRDATADFGHPSVPAGDPLRPHVLYRLSVDRQRGVPSGS
jgi:RimJ/RimL family protein N-acetyltransferase